MWQILGKETFLLSHIYEEPQKCPSWIGLYIVLINMIKILMMPAKLATPMPL